MRTKPERSSGRRLRVSVVRSITSEAATALIVAPASANDAIAISTENCDICRPMGRSASSYTRVNARDAWRTRIAGHSRAIFRAARGEARPGISGVYALHWRAVEYVFESASDVA